MRSLEWSNSQREKRIEVTRSRWGVRSAELLFSGYGVSVWEDETVLENGYTTESMYLRPLNCTLKS